MADTMRLENNGRRGTVVSKDSNGDSFNAFSGVVNSTLPAAAGSTWLPLYEGVHALTSGEVSYIRLTSTDNLYPDMNE